VESASLILERMIHYRIHPCFDRCLERLPLPSLIPRKYAKRLLRMGGGVARLWGEGYRVFRGGNQL
jgi:hypothetical protein